jgi:transcriptional regulator with XRE-family HTH domain
MPQSFAQRLKAHRLAAGLTQIELAEKAGVGHAAVVQYELGKELPGWDNLVKLIRVFGVRLVDVQEQRSHQAKKTPLSSPLSAN